MRKPKEVRKSNKLTVFEFSVSCFVCDRYCFQFVVILLCLLCDLKKMAIETIKMVINAKQKKPRKNELTRLHQIEIALRFTSFFF